MTPDENDLGLPYPELGYDWAKLIYGLVQMAGGFLIGATLIDAPRPLRMGIALIATALLAGAVAWMAVTMPRDARRMAANHAYINARYGPPPEDERPHP